MPIKFVHYKPNRFSGQHYGFLYSFTGPQSWLFDVWFGGRLFTWSNETSRFARRFGNKKRKK